MNRIMTQMHSKLYSLKYYLSSSFIQYFHISMVFYLETEGVQGSSESDELDSHFSEFGVRGFRLKDTCSLWEVGTLSSFISIRIRIRVRSKIKFT